MNHWHPALVPDWMFLAPAALFVLLLFAQLLRFILRALRVNWEVLCAGVSGNLLLDCFGRSLTSSWHFG